MDVERTEREQCVREDASRANSAAELAKPRAPLCPSRFVGRENEFATCNSALDKAVRFRAPQLVTVLGSLGLGKTRFLQEWLGEVQGPGLRVIQASLSVPGSRSMPRGNLIGALIRQRFGIAPHMGPEASLVQFRNELQRIFADRRVAEIAALLGRFLGFDLRESPLSHALVSTPRQGADLARAVLCRFLEVDSEATPIVIAIDDLHLADDESLDLLERLTGEMGEASVLVVATARPELLLRRPEWGRTGGAHVRADLALLDPGQIAEMVSSVLDTSVVGTVPAALLERSAVESSGNPYLLEQLLHLYSRHGWLVAETAQGWWFDVEGASSAPSLGGEAAAHSRISCLSDVERQLLSRAASFGPTFWTGGIIALGRMDAEPTDPVAVFCPDLAIPEIRGLLTELSRQDLLVQQTSTTLAGDVEWAFKHPGDIDLLLAGVEPEQLARRRRFAAQWLETRSGEGREDRFEVLGQLYELGGDSRRGAYCLLTAAGNARHRGDMEQSRVLYMRATRLLGIDDAAAKMDAMYALGDVAARMGRTREALAHFQEMLRLAWRLDLPAKGGAAHGRIGRLHGTLGEHRAALVHLQISRDLFEAAGDLAGIASALDDIGRLHLLGGSPEPSLECHRAAYQVRDQLGDDRGKALALARMGQVEHEKGDLLAAEGHVRQAIDLRRRIGDRQGMVASLLDLGALERDLGRLDHAVAILEEARKLAREGGEQLFECSIDIALGDCWLDEGRPIDARPFFTEAKAIAHRFGARLLACEASRGIAESALARGEILDARDEARSAFETAERIGAPQVAGAALRVVASAVGMGAPGDAEMGGAREMFDRSIEILSNGGAELELGRAFAAYAEYEQRCGRKAAARELRRHAKAIRDQARGTAPTARPSRGRTLVADVLMKDGIAAVA